jgi:tetratricopeptide (TPR) repeat protein
MDKPRVPGRRPVVIPHLRPTTWGQYILYMGVLAGVLAGLVAMIAFFRRSAEPAEFRRQAEELYLRVRNAEAAPLAREAVRIAETREPPDSPTLAIYLNTQAKIEAALGRTEEAGAIYRRVLAIREKEVGPDDPFLLSTLNNLGDIARKRGQLPEAEAFYARALGITDKVLGSIPAELRETLVGLGTVYADQGKADAAGPLLDRALAYQDDQQLMNRAAEYDRKRRSDEAEMIRKQGLDYLDTLIAQYEKIGRTDDVKKLKDRWKRIRFKGLPGPE